MMFGSEHGNERQKLIQVKGVGPNQLQFQNLRVENNHHQWTETDVDVFLSSCMEIHIAANQPTSQLSTCPMRRDRWWVSKVRQMGGISLTRP